MPNMVYVLTTLVEKKEWRPVAVVDETNLDVANQWVAASKNNDWVPLEMNDMSLTGLGDMPTNFKPLPTPTVDASVQEMKGVNARLIRIIQQLAERYKDKDILKVLERMKNEKTATVEEVQDWDEETLKREGFVDFELEEEKNRRWRLSHAPMCDVRSGAMSCTCKLDRLKPDASGSIQGCKECGCRWNEPHKPGCPRMAQQRLFANSLLRKND